MTTITEQLLDLTGDGHGHHIPGTPDVYRHGFIPIDGTELGEDGIRRPSKDKGAKETSGGKADGNALRGDAAYAHVAESAGKRERDAADYYSVGSGRLNPALRNGTALTDKTDKAQVRNLESAFAKAPPTTRHIVAYRGTTGALFGKGDATGTHFVDNGFTSVSTDQRQAGMFGSEADPALMEIHIPAGSKVIKPGTAGHYSDGDAEKELVLNHGGHYEITSDQTVKDPQLGKIRKLTATYRGPATSAAGGAALSNPAAGATRDKSKFRWHPGDVEIIASPHRLSTVTADLAADPSVTTITAQLNEPIRDSPGAPGLHIPGYTGQGWSTHETMLIVRWLFAHPDVWEQAMDAARDPISNPHTVADTLHEQLVPRAELDQIAAQGFDPAKVNWLEIAHELIERRGDPQPAHEQPGITPATITAQLAGETITALAAGYDLNPRSGMISLDLPPGTIAPAPGGPDDVVTITEQALGERP